MSFEYVQNPFRSPTAEKHANDRQQHANHLYTRRIYFKVFLVRDACAVHCTALYMLRPAVSFRPSMRLSHTGIAYKTAKSIIKQSRLDGSLESPVFVKRKA